MDLELLRQLCISAQAVMSTDHQLLPTAPPRPPPPPPSHRHRVALDADIRDAAVFSINWRH